MNSPRLAALRDISEYLKDEPKYGNEIWNVLPAHLDNKYTRRLNQQLGLWGVNKSHLYKNFKK
jgi:hypothetical protein